MPYGQFSSYEPAGGGAYRFRTRDGKEYVFTGEAAERLRSQLDAPRPQRIGFGDGAVFVEAPPRTGYEAQDLTAIRDGAAEEQRRAEQGAARAPMSMREAVADDARVGERITGNAPGSPGARVDEARRVRERPADAAKALARSTAVGAVDTAMLPVTLPARAARAAGVKHPAVETAADLSADKALEDAAWLATDVDGREYQRGVALEREEFPAVTGAGAEIGAALATAPLGPAMRGLSRRSVVANADEAAEFLRKHPKGDAVEALTHGSEGDNRYLRAKATGKVTPRGQNPYAEKRAADAAAALDDAAAAGHGYKGPVTRGLDLPEDVVADWLEKGAVRNESFWSTSADPHYLDDFFGQPLPGRKQVVLRMKDTGGVPISRFSLHPNESEVLIPPGRNWAIAGQNTDHAGRLVLDLERVESAPGAAISFDDAGSLGLPTPQSTAKEDARRRQENYGRER